VNAPLTEQQIADLKITRSHRVATEVCSGPGYPCMACGRHGQVVLWEYDIDAREVLGVTCVDHAACEAAYVEREAERAVYMAAHEGGWA
jgi:hypothetical protein